MTNPKQFSFDRLASAGQALLIAGAVGAIIGLITGLICGVFFFIFGALFGAIWGMPTGFCVGVLASAIGGRRVWRVTGVLCGMLGALSMVAGLGEKGLAQNVTDSGSIGLLVVGIAGVGGFIAGGFADAQRSHGPSVTGLFGFLGRVLANAGVEQLRLPLRLALASLDLIPMLFILWKLMKYAAQMVPSYDF